MSARDTTDPVASDAALRPVLPGDGTAPPGDVPKPRPRQARPVEPPDEADFLARATWSRLAEPADHAAAILVAGLGAPEALAWARHRAEHGSGRPEPPPLPEHLLEDVTPRRWASAVERWAPRLAGLDIRRELDVLERLGGSLVVPGDPWWPPGMDDLEQPPFCLWLRGDPALLVGREEAGAGEGALGLAVREDRMGAGRGAGHALALVGARDSTAYGERMAIDLARGLTECGALIVSGGAFGIDAAAHRGALTAGPTLSVSAGGVDRLYPAGNTTLLQAVVDHGALVAEVPPGSQPARHRFLTRNRIIAAMTGATLVVEAAWRSGALSTAHHAMEIGRPVGAVPGPVTSMASGGCHRLLRQGATCVTDVEEALELLLPMGAADADAPKEELSEACRPGLLDGLDAVSAVVVDALPVRAAASIESVARAAGLSERETLAALGALELAGRAQSDGARWRRPALCRSAPADRVRSSTLGA
ncbi:DNA-processing protein DprA [Actinomyces gaoshouyii]|uniref:DNA processing protein DprA n=1 Tax=Actinomyces gaoshouyii TaxID=1960083 RepID=A0A8H9LLB7_9ACTO|nr:DNA-processing protein DprA [Actinomyces gaoshouyii]GGO97175.1 DNA processing protein DprA [Actinomyces gaoshouyii]